MNLLYMSYSSAVGITFPVPVGSVIWFAGQSIQPNYILADGSTLNIVDYPELFSVINTTFGGNGSTTFALPNLIANYIRGADVTSGTITPSNASGSSSVTLNALQMPTIIGSFPISNFSATATIDGNGCRNINPYSQAIGASGAYVKSDSTKFGGSNSQLSLDESAYGSNNPPIFTMGSASPSPLPVVISGTLTPNNLGLLPCIRYTNKVTNYNIIPNTYTAPFTNYSINPLLNIPPLSGFVNY